MAGLGPILAMKLVCIVRFDVCNINVLFILTCGAMKCCSANINVIALTSSHGWNLSLH